MTTIEQTETDLNNIISDATELLSKIANAERMHIDSQKISKIREMLTEINEKFEAEEII